MTGVIRSLLKILSCPTRTKSSVQLRLIYNIYNLWNEDSTKRLKCHRGHARCLEKWRAIHALSCETALLWLWCLVHYRLECHRASRPESNWSWRGSVKRGGEDGREREALFLHKLKIHLSSIRQCFSQFLSKCLHTCLLDTADISKFPPVCPP